MQEVLLSLLGIGAMIIMIIILFVARQVWISYGINKKTLPVAWTILLIVLFFLFLSGLYGWKFMNE